MAAHNEMGRRGEDLAARYLEEKGYCILERNWANRGRKEIDIIATKDDVCVFVEVKTRKAGSIITPQEAVNARKQHNICLAADSYLRSHYIDIPFRFDIVGIVVAGEEYRIDHMEDAFRPRPRFYS